MVLAAAPDTPSLKVRQVGPDAPYLLGAGDELSVHVAEMEQFSVKAFQIDPNGVLHLPVVGNIKAGGMPVEELESAIAAKLRTYVLKPEVTVGVSAFHSQPVSVVGAVNQPGVHQLTGPTRLLEMISSAGGPRNDAGGKVRITRELEWGSLPLGNATTDAGGKWMTADVDLNELTKGREPEQNIFLRPHDVISVDQAQLIYVLGDVNKSGGFPLHSHENLTVLQAIALADGLQRTASPKNARILRKGEEVGPRTEIAVDVKKILAGKADDVGLRPEDVLYIPNSIAHTVAVRSIEMALQVGTGIVIWRR
ncbi:MAG: polysaccharide biosynthesis/export protein [Bryobacterales bacterium]|jgi:polysaccharide export outer membrane protein|nr:polysaccharide biosynthesis/export protein [Bryobacterales bacterium]